MKRSISALAMMCLAVLIAFSPALAHRENTHGKQDAGTAAVEAAPARAADNASPGDVMTLLRNLHPATVHFAIALFVVAGLTEAVGVFHPSTEFEGTVRIMVMAGAAGAIIAAVFGWIHTGLWLGGDGTMQLHRWIGMAIALVGTAAAIVANNRPQSRTLLRAALIILTIAIVAQGYLGGELAHGAGHLWKQ
ncbi:MAG: hypothetical protein P1U62_09625 [Alteraurantiacibacter sp. bin_em_oilr2.035]|nr:hypothetical protein [Alteraurantiacibacter sp. bin_em_oilr2.035]